LAARVGSGALATFVHNGSAGNFAHGLVTIISLAFAFLAILIAPGALVTPHGLAKAEASNESDDQNQVEFHFPCIKIDRLGLKTNLFILSLERDSKNSVNRI
jgi:hypothetical protein